MSVIKPNTKHWWLSRIHGICPVTNIWADLSGHPNRTVHKNGQLFTANKDNLVDSEEEAIRKIVKSLCINNGEQLRINYELYNNT